MLVCHICYEEILYFPYKSSCNCNLVYHAECISEWYKHNKTCIQCRKKDSNSSQFILRKKNRVLESVSVFTSIVLFGLFYIFACYFNN